MPPWIVSLGAVFIANASCSFSVAWVRRIRINERGEIAHPVRQLLLPDRADVLDDGGLDHRLLAGLQHACDRDRHPPHGVKLRDQASDSFRAAGVRVFSDGANQFGQHVIGLQEAFRPGALIGEFAGGLLPGAVDFAEHVIVGHEGIGEYDFVEFELPGDLADRIDLDARRLHVDQKLRQAVAAIFLGRR